MHRFFGRFFLFVGVSLVVATVADRPLVARTCIRPPVLSVQDDVGYRLGISFSGDGRIMVFSSTSDDILPADANTKDDIFAYDTLTCTLELVSVSSTGVQGNGDSSLGDFAHSSISDDGRYVVFASEASNLIADDTNNIRDVFLRDRQLGITTLVSQSTTGVRANGFSDLARISGNGQIVAFTSAASNLVPFDTNAMQDAFVRDLVAGTTERVSVASDGSQGTLPFGTWTSADSLSNDGRFVTIQSGMNSLVAGDTNNAIDIFVRDRQLGTTVRASVSSAGAQASSYSYNSSISGDGRLVVFASVAVDLVANDSNGFTDVFIRDMQAGTTTLAPLGNHAGPPNDHTWDATISGNGRYLAVNSAASNLVPGDTEGISDIFVLDLQTGVTRRVSTTADGVQAGADSWFPALSEDGLTVGFESGAANLVPGDGNEDTDVFSVRWSEQSATQDVDLIVNGSFDTTAFRWLFFATPTTNHIVWQITDGVLEFRRTPPPPGTPGQAVVFQQTRAQVHAGDALHATFDLANPTAARKRVSVLIHDEDFSDLSVCTFWLAPFAPASAYAMRTHTTDLWSGATISFYAATASETGFIQLDNVSLEIASGGAGDRTECDDPAAPAAPGGVDGPNLVANPGFASGLSPWGTFGQIVWQVAGEVFEFYRPAGTPAGVVLQSLQQTASVGEIFTASFELGNSSPVRKRVTVLLHDVDFSDLHACTFFLAPATPLAGYTMRTYATEAWQNATVSFYAATVGIDEWIRLDNVSVQRTPGTAPMGTECLEPAGGLDPASTPATSSINATVAVRSGAHASSRSSTSGSGAALGIEPAIELDADVTALAFEARGPERAVISIQIAANGDSWMTIGVVMPSDEWTSHAIDLRPFVHGRVWLRFVEDLRGATAPQTIEYRHVEIR